MNNVTCALRHTWTALTNSRRGERTSLVSLRASIFFCTALFLSGAMVSQAAADAACLASPTQSCLLKMAAEANEEASKTVTTSNTDQAANDHFIQVGEIWADILKTAVKAGDLDFALSIVPSTEKFGSFVSELIAALKLSGRDADLAAFLKNRDGYDRLGDIIYGPALVAAGRTADFKAFAASRNFATYDSAAMEAAGDFLAGKQQEGLALINALNGKERRFAGNNARTFLHAAGHDDLAEPLLEYQDLRTVDGAEICAVVAQQVKSKALAEKCLAAVTPLSGAGARDHFYLTAVAPQLVGALAAAGDWEQALTLLHLVPREANKRATEKLVQFSHSPELIEKARKSLGPPGPQAGQRGGLFVRMLVLAGQPDEAAKFAATAPDAATRDEWSRMEAAALAEMGDTTTALPLADKISDPFARAYALCAIAKALKN